MLFCFLVESVFTSLKLYTKTMQSFLEIEIMFSPLLFPHKCRRQEVSGIYPVATFSLVLDSRVLVAQHPPGWNPVPVSVDTIAQLC